MERLLAKLRGFRAGKDLTEEFSLKDDVVKVFLPDFRRNITAVKIPYEGSTFTQQEWMEWISINLKDIEGDAVKHASLLMQKFMQGAKYIETLTRNERGKPDFQLPTMLITIKNDADLGVHAYNAYVDSIMTKAGHLRKLSMTPQDEIIQGKFNGVPLFSVTTQQHMILAGIEEADHAAYYRYVGSPITVPPSKIRSVAQHDAEPIEIRALHEQQRYTYSHRADFLPEQLKILDARIQAAEALSKKR